MLTDARVFKLASMCHEMYSHVRKIHLFTRDRGVMVGFRGVWAPC